MENESKIELLKDTGVVIKTADFYLSRKAWDEKSIKDFLGCLSFLLVTDLGGIPDKEEIWTLSLRRRKE